MKNMAKLVAVLLFALSTQMAFSQSRTISGVVKSAENGESLPGVAILEKGTQNGTVTNFEGKFDITVTTANPVLVFQALGKEAKEVTLGAETFLSVSLSESTEQLEEVVVTALGISKQKKALGYAVSTIGGDDVQRSGENNIISSLNAKAPGIQVVSSGGTPGASSKILIRGNSTFTGQNQPLIVVDGVPIDNSTVQSTAGDNPFNSNLSGVNNANRGIDINPDDIESVTVLKGPAAAALYGARAGNGAIIYTTKRGKMGAKRGLGVTVSQNITFNQVNKLPDMQTTFAQGAGGGTPAGDAAATFDEGDPGPDETYFTADDISLGTANSWGPSISSLGIESFDNPGNFFRTGVSSNTNISISGGTERSSVRLSMGYLTDQGMVPNTNYNRASVRLTADTKLSDKVKVGGTVNYINSQSTASQNGSNLSGIMLGLLRAPASYDLRDYQYENGNQRTYFAFYDNPYYTAYENPFTSSINRVLGNVYANYQALDWLSFTYKVGADAYGDNRQQIFAISSQGDDIGGVGQVNTNQLFNLEFYQDFIANATTKLSDNWNANFLLGHNVQMSRFSDNFARGRILAIRDFYNLSNASDLYSSNLNENVNTMAFFGQAEFDWKNTFFVTFTGRNEWSSTFELDNNNFFYPSVSTSLVFTEFWDSRPDWFNFGKVRYSYAQTGISPIPYRTRSLYTTPIYTDGFTDGLSFPYRGQNGFGISDILYTSDLLPERLSGNEVGLNLIFLDRKIDFDITLYRQVTTDALLFQPLANSSGFTDAYVNGGEIQNQGVEIQLGLVPVRTDNFSYRVDINWARNVSKTLALVPGVNQFSIEAAFASIGSFAIVDQPYGVFYGTVWERDGDGNLLIGANGLPTQAAQTAGVGDPNPDWLAGIRNTFNYKGIELSFLFDFRKGGDIWNGTYARLNNIGKTAESAENREQTYLIEGVYAEGTTINGQDVSGQENTTRVNAIDYFRRYVGDAGGASEQFVEEVNWVRLRDVNLSYRFNLRNAKLGLDYLDVSFNGRNLLLFTDYKGVDPETSLTGAGSNIGGLDYFNNPGARSFSFGVKFGF
jgi:TonB-linked SusC/RagA family outer membrane protein